MRIKLLKKLRQEAKEVVKYSHLTEEGVLVRTEIYHGLDLCKLIIPIDSIDDVLLQTKILLRIIELRREYVIQKVLEIKIQRKNKELTEYFKNI